MTDFLARNKAKRIAQERGLGGMANDTKWREFFIQVEDLKIPLEVKILYEDSGSTTGTSARPKTKSIAI